MKWLQLSGCDVSHRAKERIRNNFHLPSMANFIHFEVRSHTVSSNLFISLVINRTKTAFPVAMALTPEKCNLFKVWPVVYCAINWRIFYFPFFARCPKKHAPNIFHYIIYRFQFADLMVYDAQWPSSMFATRRTLDERRNVNTKRQHARCCQHRIFRGVIYK